MGLALRQARVQARRRVAGVDPADDHKRVSLLLPRRAALRARGTLSYVVRHKYLKPSAVDEKGKVFNLFIVVFGFVGFWSQFWSGFNLPFPLNILLLPVRLAEWGLRVLVFMLG